MFERGGARIAVIGQALPRTAVANPRWMFPNWEFGIREEDMQKQVDESRAAGADIVVLLSHNGFDVDRKLAGRVKGIDVILTAHTHDAMPGLVRVGDTVLVAAGSHGKFVARLDIEVRDQQGRRRPLQADAGVFRCDQTGSGDDRAGRKGEGAVRRRIWRASSARPIRCCTAAAISTAPSTI